MKFYIFHSGSLTGGQPEGHNKESIWALVLAVQEDADSRKYSAPPPYITHTNNAASKYFKDTGHLELSLFGRIQDPSTSQNQLDLCPTSHREPKPL